MKQNLFLWMTVLGVTLGVLIGIILSLSEPSETALEVIYLPGELLLRMLKALVLPLISAR